MTYNPGQPTATEDTEDAEDAVSVVCGHTWFDQQLNQYAFVLHIYGSRQRFTLHHTSPIRYRLGHTYRADPHAATWPPGRAPARRKNRPGRRRGLKLHLSLAMENVMTPTPTPLNLTSYLEQLAAHVGYAVDWSELDPTLANQPDPVTAWVLAAARHAGLAHARGLLAAPAAFLREQVGAGDFNDSTGCEVAMLFGLHEHNEHLDAEIDKAAAAFAGCCQQLAATGPSSPTTAPGPVADVPTQAGPPDGGT